MRRPTDALRSIGRYVALALGPDWEVAIAQERGAFQRPSARVEQVPNIQTITSRWSQSKFIASYVVMAFPVSQADAATSLLEAQRIADVFWTAFAGPGVGTPNVRLAADSNRARPYRVPLYDYDGIAYGDPVDETRRDERDFLHMEGPPEIQTLPDPDDELLYSVAANIRMSWLRSAAVTSAAPTAQSVPVGEQLNG